MRLRLQRATIARGGRALLSELDLRFEPGTVSVLAGPNGAGKSSLLAAIAGDLPLPVGDLLLDDQPIDRQSLAARARVRAMLRQQSDIAFGFPVRDVAAMGLHPFGLDPASPQAAALVQEALADLDLLPLADRPATELSGGEMQRVQLARVLVQARTALHMPDSSGILLLLDEPTTGLDYRHQLALQRIIHAIARDGATIICSLHDLPFACRIADRLLLLGQGRLMADVRPDALDPAQVAALYDIDEADVALILSERPPGWKAAA